MQYPIAVRVGALMEALWCARRLRASGKGQQGTVWVLHRSERVWDANTFEDGGAGQSRRCSKQPIGADVVLQLDQDTGAASACELQVSASCRRKPGCDRRHGLHECGAVHVPPWGTLGDCTYS